MKLVKGNETIVLENENHAEAFLESGWRKAEATAEASKSETKADAEVKTSQKRKPVEK